jgi:hypothetical protein
MAMHSGEKANQTADLQCSGCQDMIHVDKGQTIPKCDCGSTTFQPAQQPASANKSNASQQKYKKTG